MELLVAKTRLPTNMNTQTYEQTTFALRDSLLISRDKLWIMYPLGACASARRGLWLKCWDRVFGVVSKVKNICQWWHSDWRSVSILHRIFLAQIAAQTIKAQYIYIFFFADDHQALYYYKAAWQYCFFPELTIGRRLPDVVVAAGCHPACVGAKAPKMSCQFKAGPHWKTNSYSQSHTPTANAESPVCLTFMFLWLQEEAGLRGEPTQTQGGHANSAQKAPGPETRCATLKLRGNGATKQCVNQSIIASKKKRKKVNNTS